MLEALELEEGKREERDEVGRYLASTDSILSNQWAPLLPTAHLVRPLFVSVLLCMSVCVASQSASTPFDPDPSSS